jgi:hypothetical protein
MPSAQPKRTPAAVKVSGARPAVYISVDFVFDSMRSS